MGRTVANSPHRRRCSLRLLTLAAALLVAAPGCGPPQNADSDNPTSARRTTPAPAPRDRAAPPSRARATPTGGLRVTGKLHAMPGQTLPAKAKVALMFVVSSGSPDYVYAFGTGTSTGATFELTLSGPPPTAALNNTILGIGMVLLLPSSTPVPTGRLNRRAWRNLVKASLGGADRFGVLYRNPAIPDIKTRSWMGQFKAGYRCGKGFKPANRRFEGFNPIPCTDLIIRVAPFKSLNWVNWT